VRANVFFATDHSVTPPVPARHLKLTRDPSSHDASNSLRRLMIFRGGICCAAAILIAIQLFATPVIGLSDQGDFARVIGRFGYAREDKSTPLSDAYVAPKYIRDPQARFPDLEQLTSEYIFVGAAVLLNKVVSRDGKLDIVLMGFVHAAVFLAAFARLLSVLRNSPLAWILAAFTLTDIGYVAYWNSFYSEPASCIFFVLLLAESIAILGHPALSGAGPLPPARPPGRASAAVLRWSLWAALLILAKPQNFMLAALLAPFILRIGWKNNLRFAGAAGALAIAITGVVCLRTFSRAGVWATTYDQIFLAILPDSKDRAADLKDLGIDPRFATYAGTGAWTPRTALQELVGSGVIGGSVTPVSVARFYVRHPTRMWRRAKAFLPIAFSLRPEWCGNFERVAGYPPGTKSTSFAVWSAFHERFLTPIGKWILIVLAALPLALAVAWVRAPAQRMQIEFGGLLALGCLAAFGVAAFGDAWDNVKHCFLFNLQLDACLITAVCLIVRRPLAR
jgi:hypothetical protein